MRLPSALEQKFLRELQSCERAQQMPYVTSIERIGIKKGIEQGIEQGIRQGEGILLLRLIESKSGAPDDAVVRQVREADVDTLLQWSERILTAETLSDVLR